MVIVQQVFLRELISNASDALEKLRYMQQANAAASGHDADLRIDIFTDAENGTLTIQAHTGTCSSRTIRTI